MTGESEHDCRQRLVELRQWFESLPPGTAEMSVASHPKRYPVEVEIRPLLNREAAGILVGFDGAVFDVWAGMCFFNDIPCSQLSPADYCRSIVAGGLTHIEHTWLGIPVYDTARLLLGDELVVDRSYTIWGCILAPFRWLLRSNGKHITAYPPYYHGQFPHTRGDMVPGD